MGRRLATVLIVTVAASSAVAMASCSDDADIPARATSTPRCRSARDGEDHGEGFDPDSATVQAGEAVTFENDDDQDHRVVADDATFNTGTLKPGESTVVLFSEAGTVKYADALDPSHTGQIEVTA